MLSVFTPEPGKPRVLDASYIPFQDQSLVANEAPLEDRRSITSILREIKLQVSRLPISDAFRDALSTDPENVAFDNFDFKSRCGFEGRAAFHASEILLDVDTLISSQCDFSWWDLPVEVLFLRDLIESHFASDRLKDRCMFPGFEPTVSDEIFNQMKIYVAAERPDQNSQTLTWRTRHAFVQAIGVHFAARDLPVDQAFIHCFRYLSGVKSEGINHVSNWHACEAYFETTRRIKEYCLDRFNEPDHLSDFYPDHYRSLDLCYYFPELIGSFNFTKINFDPKNGMDREVAKGVTLSLLTDRILDEVPDLDRDIVCLALNDTKRMISNVLFRSQVIRVGTRVAGIAFGAARRIAVF